MKSFIGISPGDDATHFALPPPRTISPQESRRNEAHDHDPARWRFAAAAPG
jgi:hypothetical protein